MNLLLFVLLSLGFFSSFVDTKSTVERKNGTVQFEGVTEDNRLLHNPFTATEGFTLGTYHYVGIAVGGVVLLAIVIIAVVVCACCGCCACCCCL